MNDQIMDTLFGPLGKQWCLYFYAVSIFFFIMFVMTAISIVGLLISRKTKLADMTMYIFSLFNILLMYFVNRLLYTMCVL